MMSKLRFTLSLATLMLIVASGAAGATTVKSVWTGFTRYDTCCNATNFAAADIYDRDGYFNLGQGQTLADQTWTAELIWDFSSENVAENASATNMSASAALTFAKFSIGGSSLELLNAVSSEVTRYALRQPSIADSPYTFEQHKASGKGISGGLDDSWSLDFFLKNLVGSSPPTSFATAYTFQPSTTFSQDGTNDIAVGSLLISNSSNGLANVDVTLFARTVTIAPVDIDGGGGGGTGGVSDVPLPAAFPLFAVALAGLAAMGRRAHRSRSQQALK